MSISAGQLVAERLRQARFFLYADSIPNVQIILEAAQRNEVDPELIWREDVVDNVIERCIAGSSFTGSGEPYYAEISENPKLRAALDGVYTRYPRFARNVANDGMLIEAAAQHQLKAFDAQSLIDMVTEDATLFNSLAKSEQFVEQQSALREREQMIHDLTKGGTSGFTLMTQYGSRRNFDKNGYEITFSSSGGRSTKKNGGFENFTDDQIREMHAHVMEKRKLIAMASAGTLSQHARNEGQKRLEERFHGDPTKYVPPMPTEETQAVVLVDPRNGKAITTRQQLVAYITSSRDALSRLVHNKQGKTIPERALAVDRLLATR